MKRNFIVVIAAVLLFSGCGTYTGSGAYTGSMIGTILGSAVGGLSGGWRGNEVGKIVGLAGGAAVGAAVGAAADKKVAESKERYYEQRRQAYEERANSSYNNNQNYSNNNQQYDGSGYDANGGHDDRIYMDNSSNNSSYSISSYTSGKDLEIRNLQFVGANQSGSITPNTESKVVFEVVNNTNSTIYDVRPSVKETTGNKHIYVSPDARVESIPAKGAVRYTAFIKSDKSLKDGSATFSAAVAQGTASAIDTQAVTVSTVR